MAWCYEREMDRRLFLGASAVAGAAGVAASSCVGVGASVGSTELEDELLAALRRIDLGMTRLGTPNLLEGFLPELPAFTDPRRQELSMRGEELGRKSMRMLFLVGAVGDLPQTAQLDPRIQTRLHDALPEMDEAMLGMTDFLADLSGDEKAALKQELHERPESLDDIGMMLDRQAEAADVPMKRRLHLRALVKNVGWRMQRQSPAAVIDEYVEKVRKVEARHGDEAQAQRMIAAQATEQLLWAQQGVPTPPPLVPVNEPEAQQPAANGLPATAREDSRTTPHRLDTPKDDWVLPSGRRGTVPMTVGGILLGVGAITLVASGIGLASPGGAIFGVTVGAMVALAGLIVLLIGVIRYVKSKPPDL